MSDALLLSLNINFIVEIKRMQTKLNSRQNRYVTVINIFFSISCNDINLKKAWPFHKGSFPSMTMLVYRLVYGTV